MTLTSNERRDLSLLRAKIRELEKPTKDAARKGRSADRRARHKALKASAAPNKRQERQHDKAYLAHVRRQPCIVGPILGGCEGRIDPAHLRFGEPKVGRLNPGMGKKPDDRWVLPLCRKHHEAQHAAGNERRWWAQVGIDPNAACIERYAAFSATQPRGVDGTDEG
jgi:hypothetical protein